MNQRKEAPKPPVPRPEKLLTEADRSRQGLDWECPKCHRKLPRTVRGAAIDLGFVDRVNGDCNGSYDVFLIDLVLGHMCVECAATLLMESLTEKHA